MNTIDNEKRRHRDLIFDVHPLNSATLDDLDRVRFENEYLRAAVAPDVLEANDRTYEQRLAATKMVAAANDPVPTVLGVLVIGKAPLDFLPGAYVQFLRIAGTDLADPVVDEARMAGPILPIVQQVEAKLVAHNRVAVDFTSGERERRAAQYPLVAFSNWCATPYSTASMKARTRPCLSTGSMTASKSSTRVAPTGTSQCRTSASRG